MDSSELTWNGHGGMGTGTEDIQSEGLGAGRGKESGQG